MRWSVPPYTQRIGVFMLSRRTFLNTSAAAFTARLFAAPAGAKTPNADLEKLGAVALAEGKKLKASYCDIRIIRTRQQFLNIRLNPERGTGKTLEVPGVGDGGSFGFGVRVIVDGARSEEHTSELQSL